jgi:hypothetical protein
LIDWIELWTDDASGSLHHQSANLGQILELLKAMQEKMDANHEKMLAKMDSFQGKIDANQ